jgi:hypothetical protein
LGKEEEKAAILIADERGCSYFGFWIGKKEEANRKGAKKGSNHGERGEGSLP